PISTPIFQITSISSLKVRMWCSTFHMASAASPRLRICPTRLMAWKSSMWILSCACAAKDADLTRYESLKKRLEAAFLTGAYLRGSIEDFARINAPEFGLPEPAFRPLHFKLAPLAIAFANR